jgi:pimeloyl-ACP methyl ester carboxylesterase
VLWGEADAALLPGLLQGLERWVPLLDLRRVPEAGHWLVHEQPGRVAGLIAGLCGAGPAGSA